MDNDIKKILKDKFEHPDIELMSASEQADNWHQIERKLSSPKKRIIWWQIAVAASVGLLIGIAGMGVLYTPSPKPSVTYIKAPVQLPPKPPVEYVPATPAPPVIVVKENNGHRVISLPTITTTKTCDTPSGKGNVAENNKVIVSRDTVSLASKDVPVVHLLDLNNADIMPVVRDYKRERVHTTITFFQNPVQGTGRSDEQSSIAQGLYKK